MKNFYGLMIITGIVLALVTAGGADSNTIGMGRMFFQVIVASFLLLTGTHYMTRGEEA